MTTERRQGSASWPWIAIVVAGFVTLIASLVVPPDAVQEELSRILYVHVPAAWLAYVSFAVTMVASGMYLARDDLKWDRIAAASAEVGVFFTGLTLVVGMIWGKSTWGVWWNWDARLTLTAIMFFVYLGYLALRRTTTNLESRAKQSAILGVVAVVQLPLVHFSVEWWRGLHQTATVIRPAAANMDSSMVFTLFLVVAMFSIIYAALMAKLVELANLEEQIIRREQSSTGPVAGEAVSAPNLGAGGR